MQKTGLKSSIICWTLNAAQASVIQLLFLINFPKHISNHIIKYDQKFFAFYLDYSFHWNTLSLYFLFC